MILWKLETLLFLAFEDWRDVMGGEEVDADGNTADKRRGATVSCFHEELE